MPLSSDEQERSKQLSSRLHVLDAEQQERLARRRADDAQLPYVNLTVFPIDVDVLELVQKPQAAQARAVLFYKKGKDIRLGAVNPQLPGVQELAKQLEDRYGTAVQVHAISDRSLRTALGRYRRDDEAAVMPEGEMRIEAGEAASLKDTLSSLSDLGQRITSLSPSQTLSAIVLAAVQMEASDIHIEPQEKRARLRFRIDGVLQDVLEFDRDGWALMLSRIKALSRLKLNVHEVPQDGSFVLRIDPNVFDLRVSVLPGGYGETIVIRILDRKAEVVSITDLGMKTRDFATVTAELKKPNGMILVTGPTGSGKTTTLASFIHTVNNPEVKIITLEDPIEYRLPGVQQTQVEADAGYTFARGLRSILRQDPDMILVGEMRDIETAETAVHAALTGHLVFSTLHTNDAPGAVPRMLAMGVKPYVLAPALNLIIAQRLVRMVCAKCAESYKPDRKLVERIIEALAGVRRDVFDPAVLRKPNLTFLRAQGCPACHDTGYRGRRGVFEIFAVQGEIEELVLKGADGDHIRAAALRQGMTTIAQDAYLKVIGHITTLEEVERIAEA